MKTLIVYYTYGGTSRKEAEKLKKENKDSVLCEVLEEKKRNTFTAYFIGCPQAMMRKASKLQKIKYSFTNFQRIIIVCPIWAGSPAPAFNAIVNLLPRGKEVELYFCSGSGQSAKSEAGTKKLIEKMGCKPISYHNIKKGA